MLDTFKRLLKKDIISEQYSLNSSINELKFACKRSDGHRLDYLYNRFIWYFAPKMNMLTRFPTHIDIEISNLCQLKCPMCYTTTDYYRSKVEKSLLSFDYFKKIIDEISHHKVYSIRLSWRGEPLIHPQIIEMVTYAKNAGIKEVSFLTNGGLLKPKLIDDLILNGVDWITVSVDGLFEIYEEYRKPLKFEETISSLKLIQKRKKELKQNKPVIKVQTIWPAIENNPEEYYMYMKDFVDEIAFNPLKDKRYYKEFDVNNYNSKYVCPRLWQRIYVSSSGNIGFCLSDVYEEYIIGNIKDMTIQEAWSGVAFKTIREKHLNHERFEYSICRRCQAGMNRSEMSVNIEDRTVKATQYNF